MSRLVILGLDPGLASCGWALLAPGEGEGRVLGMGVVRTSKSHLKRQVLSSADDFRRSRELASQLAAVRGAHRVVAFAIEAMSLPRSSTVASKIGRAYGVIAGLATAWDVPVVEASPQDVKFAVCGRKTASKSDIIEALAERYESSEAIATFQDTKARGLWEHAFDALGAIVACRSSDVLRAMSTMARVDIERLH